MSAPIPRGVALAIAAAVAFGATTPIVAWVGQWIGPWTTAALLYIGASALALALPRRGPRLGRADLPRVAAIALAGAALAPALMAWGLHRAGAVAGALLLNLEAVFTVGLARIVHREPIGRHVALALLAMFGGGALLVLDTHSAATWELVGAIAVAGSTLCWAIDNTLSRPLAERDALAVVAVKASLGAAFSITAALIAREPWPPLRPALALLISGAIGYGLGLQLYLLAQRRIGAGRTASVFAIAPFVGAGLAIAVGDRVPGPWTAGAAALFAVGVVLHLIESHDHGHLHLAIDHDHLHRHDDGHHDHAHDPPVVGEHSHLHHHERQEHAHSHAPDVHHDHH